SARPGRRSGRRRPRSARARAPRLRRRSVRQRGRASHARALFVRFERSGHGNPALELGAEVRKHNLDRSKRGRDVEDVEVADVADPEDLPFQDTLAVRDRNPEPVAQAADELRRIDPVGRADCRYYRRTVVVGREELEAHRLGALAAGAAEADVALEDGVESLIEQDPKCDVEPGYEGDRRREGGVERGLTLLCPL